MRTILAGALALFMAAPAFAQLEGARDLSDFVRKFNERTSKAVEEYHRTGDYEQYKRTIEPLLDDLKDRTDGLRETSPPDKK